VHKGYAKGTCRGCREYSGDLIVKAQSKKQNLLVASELEFQDEV
jgi:hypothetical protein